MRKCMLLVLISIILIGCSPEITKEAAEKIAIDTAISEGYGNPELYDSEENIKKYHYSVQDQKDIQVWRVTLITSEREQVVGLMGDLRYFIDVRNGNIVDKSSAVDWYV